MSVSAPYFIADDVDPDTVFITVPYAARCVDRSRVRIYQLVGEGRVRSRVEPSGRLLVALTDLLGIFDGQDTPMS